MNRLAGSLVAVALLLPMAACGHAPVQQAEPDAKPPAASGPASTPTQTPSPTPAVDKTKLMPGTNHNYGAKEYVYEAKDVHSWLVEKDRSATYPKDKKVVFLTFDDGPNNRMTPKVLDMLKKLEVPATFYYVTNKTGLEGANPEIVKRAIAEGHSIDIHTSSHNYKYLYPGGRGNADNILNDRKKAVESVRSVLGPDYKVSGYRYPGGHMSWKSLEASDQKLADEGAYWIDWNAMNGDAEAKAPTTADGMVQLTKSTFGTAGKPNVAVVLMHDHQYADLTVAALPGIVDYFKEQGYEFGVIN